MEMDKSQYGGYPPPPAGIAPPPAGIAPPPGYSLPNTYPPNTYPPQNSYPPNTYPPNAYPPQQGNTVVITGGPTATVITSFGPESQPVVCPYCHHSVSTKVENKATTKTHMFALILCLCLCWPCCCCPYCMDSCQGRNHYCPHCNAFLGTYNN